MSVVKRERPERKRKRLPSPGGEGGSLPTPSVMVAPAPVAPTQRVSHLERLVADGLDPGARVTFLYKEEHLEIPVETLLRGASPGWLLSAISSGEDTWRLPEESPLTPDLALAFWRMLHVLNRKVPLAEGFASQLHLLPSAFLAAHLVGLERCVAELRSAVLRAPSAVLRSMRRADAPVLLRAMDLGLTSSGPKRLGVSDTLEAAEELLRSAGPELEAKVREEPGKLFSFFHVARLLRSKESQQSLRRAASHPSALAAALAERFSGQLSASQEALLRSALDGALDRDAPERMVHVAASMGQLQILRLVKDVNRFSARGETPAMLAAASGHAESLRFLMKHQADVGCRSKVGLTALDYASRNGHPEVVRLLQDPFSRLA